MFLKFLNRKTELSFLEERYKSNRFEFIILYGRRRVGKTELLKQFLTAKKHIYFLCDKRGTERNMIRFKKKLASFLNEPVIETNDPENLFEYILEKLKIRTVIIFDEFSYLVEKDSSVPSTFQIIIDEILRDSKTMLILCGSSISMMEKGVLSSKSPLYGRKTGHWKLLPLTFKDSCKFFPKNSIIKNIEFYSILSGVPFYLEKFSAKESTIQNIRKQILSKEGELYEEIDFLLKEELREPDIYKSILESIAAGKVKITEIADNSRLNVQDLDKYLKVLIRLGIIKKEIPITEKQKTKKTLYTFDDNFFHFWFKFCEPFKSDLEIKELDSITANIKSELNSFIGKKFENICKYYLKNLTSLNFSKIGRWWGHYRDESDKRKPLEIDIIALSKLTKEILFAECKWKDNVDAKRILENLKEKAKYVEWPNKKEKNHRKEYYTIFSKSFKEKIKEKNLFLFDLKDLETLFLKSSLHSRKALQ